MLHLPPLVIRTGRAILCLAVLTLSGCLERLERITINPDGSAQLSSRFHGALDDFKKTADALPEAGSVWVVTDTPSKNDKGEDELTRLCTLRVPPGQPLPGSYAAPDDPRAPFALRFPTSIRVRQSNGRTYFDFARTYTRREEAKFTYARRALTDTQEGKKLLESDPAALTPSEREKLLRTFGALEADKQSQFISSAAADLERDGVWTQDIGLNIQRAVFDAAAKFDIGPALAVMNDPPSPTRDEAIARQAAAFDESLNRAIPAALASLSVPEAQRQSFEAALTTARSTRAATEDLSDEKWEVRVRLPGTIIAHNADETGDGELVWRFSASALEDRDQVLKATSAIP